MDRLEPRQRVLPERIVFVSQPEQMSEAQGAVQLRHLPAFLAALVVGDPIAKRRQALIKVAHALP